MEAVETKIQLLGSVLSQLQQPGSCNMDDVKHLSGVVASQGLLNASSVAKNDSLVKWCQVVSTWFQYFLDKLSGKQASTIQVATQVLATSLASCDVVRFLEQYNACGAKALQCIGKGSSHACLWLVVSSIFDRVLQLVAMPGLRREASSLAAKMMAALQPALTAVGTTPDNKAYQVHLEVLAALNAALAAVPAAFRSHQKALELFVCQLLARPDLSIDHRREAAHCYAALTKIKGDAETWSSAMQRLLCSCHASLDVAFLGMDDTALAAAGKAGLDPQAQPISHAFHTPLSNGNVSAGRLGAQHGKQSVHSVSAVQTALGSLAGFLDALERMLTASYPVAVPLPSHGILMLLTRILTMDDSARQAGQVPPSASAYLALLTALPWLHSCALQLVRSLMQTARGAFTPFFASCSHLLANLLRQVAAQPDSNAAPAAANLRQQVYATASELVSRAGVGVGALLGAEAVDCALQELYGTPQSSKRASKQGLPNGQPTKKRKKQHDAELPQPGDMNPDEAQAAASLPSHGSSSAQIGALHLLQSLLQSSSSSLSQQQRSQVDAIAVHMASTASLAAEHTAQSFDGGSSPHTAHPDLQLAAMQTLLASVLSPVPHRPTFQPQALSMFCQGIYSASPQIVAFSQQALLSIEGLIHPRAGATVLQSDRSHPHHPPTQESGAVPNISMPRIWSALIPESYVQQEPNTTGASQQQPLESRAAASAAKQVLVAGRVYNEAMQQLETALKGNVNSTVSQHAALSAEGAAPYVDPAAQTEQPVATLDPALGQQPMDISAQSTDVQADEQPDAHTAKLIATEMPVVQDHLPEEPQHEPAHIQADGMGTSQEAEAKLDDGYISLLPSSGLPAGRNLQPETSQAVGMLADAESSDSQGSLPEIDSGESNSDSEDAMSD